MSYQSNTYIIQVLNAATFNSINRDVVNVVGVPAVTERVISGEALYGDILQKRSRESHKGTSTMRQGEFIPR